MRQYQAEEGTKKILNWEKKRRVIIINYVEDQSLDKITKKEYVWE